MSGEARRFACDASGYIRHWLLAGTRATVYTGQMQSENQLRRDIVDPEIVRPPADAALNAPGPFGEPWYDYDPGQNIFVEKSHFYHELSALDLYGATDVDVPEDVDLPVRLWACGTADVWVNGTHICRHNVPRYMYPEGTEVTLPLKAGRNRLSVRLQALGVRDTRYLFGIQALVETDRMEVWLPGDEAVTGTFVEIEDWLNTVRVSGQDVLCATYPAPVSASVRLRQGAVAWPEDTEGVVFDAAGETSPVLTVEVEGQTLRRAFDIPANRIIAPSTEGSTEEHRREVIQHMAAGKGRGRGGVMAILARHTLGERSAEDETVIFETLDWIDGRPDCADFPLACLLRLYLGGTLTDRERERVKQTALGFRYWDDEPGSDAMCFGSENHSLLFHGCQLIAGNLFPDEVFSNSGRTGAEQAGIGKDRCVKWLDGVEKRGFSEFLSSTYMPLTTGALMNLVDFAGDEAMSRRAAGLVDEIFRMLAMQSFDGVTVGPQGRVYRGVLSPETSGTQGMLSYAAPEAMVAYNDWLSFVAASPTYNLPDDIADVMRQPASRRYQQASVQIQVEKTEDYLLTSLQIPASFQKTPGGVEPPQSTGGLIPGRQGYQQHLWHATLGRDCHVFVNHPGESYDMGHARPGFWYGNGVIPRTAQHGATVLQIFDIPEAHPIHFTHAHWPSDVFDEQTLQENWAFGAKGTGYVGVWCSEPMEMRSEALTDRELRAQGLRVGWACICGGQETGDFEAFVQACLDLNPRFDAENLTLSMEGQEELRYA